jgi:hypothetical protein
LTAMPKLRAATMATVIQNIRQKPGTAIPAKKAAAYAKGSAKIECSSLIRLAKRRT